MRTDSRGELWRGDDWWKMNNKLKICRWHNITCQYIRKNQEIFQRFGTRKCTLQHVLDPVVDRSSRSKIGQVESIEKSLTSRSSRSSRVDLFHWSSRSICWRLIELIFFKTCLLVCRVWLHYDWRNVNSGSLYLSLRPKSETLVWDQKKTVWDLINAKTEVTLSFGLRQKFQTTLRAKTKV